jgi:hypothetical protein
MKEEFQMCFQWWQKFCAQCIKSLGEYFGGDTMQNLVIWNFVHKYILITFWYHSVHKGIKVGSRFKR